MSTTVNYKGNTIATLENETKKLTTKGTWLEDDIEITDTGGSGGGTALIVDTTDSHGGIIREITTDTEVKLEGAKTVTPTSSQQTITPSQGYDGFSSVIVEASSSGESALKKQINFIDYDGTILYSYSTSEWANVSALPANPSHNGLTAQGWNWSLADAKAYVAKYGRLEIGQMYITASGDTEIDVRFEEGRLSPVMTIAVNGTVTVDWGDGTTVDTVTGTSLTTREEVPHTYAQGGNYTIVIHVVSGSFGFYGNTINAQYTLLRKNTTVIDNYVYANTVQAIRLGSGITSIGQGAFNYCRSLETVTIPDSVTSIETYAFYSCSSLASVTIPEGVTSIGDSAFKSCYSLASVTIPDSVTSIETYAFSSCYSLASVIIPEGVTSIETYAFSYCNSLASVIIPDSVTSIGGSAFLSCHSLASVTIPEGVTSIGDSAFKYSYGMAEYHILPITPPTLSATNAFNNIPSDCVIYVPTGSLGVYQTATNWSTYASYMVGE